MIRKKDAATRRFPKVLAEELRWAWHGCHALGLTGMQTHELLMMYRRNCVRYIAAHGVSPAQGEEPRSPSPIKREHIPFEYFYAIVSLNDAYRKVHSYLNGGEGDYIALAVENEINRRKAKKPRPDGLTQLLYDIMSTNPDIQFTDMREQLRKHERGAVIEFVDDQQETIEWHDKNKPARTTSFQAVMTRMSRIRKNF